LARRKRTKNNLEVIDPSMMKGSVSSFFWLLIYQTTLSFGFVCIYPQGPKSGASLRLLDRYRIQVVGSGEVGSCPLLQTPRPSPIILQEARAEEASPRLTKLERMLNLIRRLRDTPPFLRIRSSYLDTRAQLRSTSTANPTFTTEKAPLQDVEEVEEYHEDTSVRQSTAADNVDLSGSWKPIVTPEFKQQYDQYLQNCSQSFMFRKVVVNGIGYQTEIIRQLNDGVDLEIEATNPAGNWLRTLVASDAAAPVNVTLTDPDGDIVQVEAWWEDNGSKHKSWLREKPRLRGGSFETTRYLESENVLVCESNFHPSPSAPANLKFKPGHVVWKYKRED